jgi:hypothetical protein
MTIHCVSQLELYYVAIFPFHCTYCLTKTELFLGDALWGGKPATRCEGSIKTINLG